MDDKFDFDAALARVQSGQSLTGKDGVLTPLIKQLTEIVLQAEMATHLKDEIAGGSGGNRRNGSGHKTIKSTSGSFELATPRDRNGSFEPQLIKKHQTHMSDEIEAKMISLFGLGMSYSDIAGHIGELYRGRKPSIDMIEVKTKLSEGLNPTQVARTLGISRGTVYKAKQQMEQKMQRDAA